jgi:hypothetical protein
LYDAGRRSINKQIRPQERDGACIYVYTCVGSAMCNVGCLATRHLARGSRQPGVPGPVCCVPIVAVCARGTLCKACCFNIVHTLYMGRSLLHGSKKPVLEMHCSSTEQTHKNDRATEEVHR